MKIKNFFKPLNKSGQVTVEMVLITALLTAACYLVLNKFKDPNFENPLVAFVSGPGKAMAGMMESGNWKKRNPAGNCADAQSACHYHPNYMRYMSTAEGKRP